MIARLIAWSASNLMLVLDRHRIRGRRRHLGAEDAAARRHPRPLRHPGHRLHRVSGAGAAGGRGPGHLSADHGDADRAADPKWCAGSRSSACRSSMSSSRTAPTSIGRAAASSNISTLPANACPPVSPRRLGPDATRRRLGLPVRRPRQEQIPCRAALAAGLGDPLRTGQGRRRRRGGQRRRLRQAIQRGHRSRPHALAGHPAVQGARGHPPEQHGCRRPHGRTCRARVHGARPRLHQERRRPGDASSSKSTAARRYCSRTSPASSLAPTSGAASPNSTVKAKSRAASPCSASAPTPSTSSPTSRQRLAEIAPRCRRRRGGAGLRPFGAHLSRHRDPAPNAV